MEDGRIADRPMFFVNVPSVLDESMRVDGNHVLSLETLYTPYSLRGGWETSHEPERWLQRLATLVEGDFESTILRWRVMTPLSYEREFNLPNGHATGFGGSPLSAMLGRHPELTRYETPVKGLYLTGAATYPGAGVWGASGAQHRDRDLAGLISAPRRSAPGVLQGNSIHLSVSRHTYSHFTTERGFS